MDYEILKEKTLEYLFQVVIKAVCYHNSKNSFSSSSRSPDFSFLA